MRTTRECCAQAHDVSDPRDAFVVSDHDVVQAGVCQLYASAGESGLVQARTGCAQAAYLCGLSYPYGRVWTFVFPLVMSRSAVRVRSSAL
jgi:hypothetical protein